jgi:hypothetical protein
MPAADGPLLIVGHGHEDPRLCGLTANDPTPLTREVLLSMTLVVPPGRGPHVSAVVSLFGADGPQIGLYSFGYNGSNQQVATGWYDESDPGIKHVLGTNDVLVSFGTGQRLSPGRHVVAIRFTGDAIVTAIDDRELSRIPVDLAHRADSCMPVIYAAAYPECGNSRVVVSDIELRAVEPR